jgi:tetratricopeptide (TPR) repeat protein
MKRLFCLIIVACVVSLPGCSTAYKTYSSDIWSGKKMLGEGVYPQAREDFVAASKADPAEPASYALAATASYKMDDLQAASLSITEAEKRDKFSDAYIRILGYKALILLKQGREQEGLDALHAYIVAYEKEYAPENVRDVRAVWRSRHIDLPALEGLLDGEIAVYESDMEQFRSSGTGWLAARYGTATPNTSR